MVRIKVVEELVTEQCFIFNALFGRLNGFRDKTKTVNRPDVLHCIVMYSFNNNCLPNTWQSLPQFLIVGN